MRILVVEDDKKISKFVASGLTGAGYIVDAADNGEDALELICAKAYDLAVMDVMLPGLDGLSVISRMREKNISLPVIILSAKHSVDDRIAGLKRGGDDYLVKPFSFSELLARIEVHLRRVNQGAEISKLVVGSFTLDLITRDVRRDDELIPLHAREMTLLEFFMRNPGRVLSKSLILERVWSYHFDPQTNAVDVLVCRLRNKVDKAFEKKTIHTLRGLGYVFRPT